jgi:AraC-like DNA-binding protein
VSVPAAWENARAPKEARTVTSRANSLTARATPPTEAAEPPPLSANVVVPFVDGLAKLGFDSPGLLAAAGIDAAALADPDGLVSCCKFGAMLGAAAGQRRVKNLALKLALVTPIGAFPLFDYLILTCSTVAEGLLQIARFMPLINNPTTFEVRLDESPVRVTLDSPGLTFNVEYSAAICILHLREETEQRFSPLALHFAHHPEDADEFAKLLKVPVTPGSAWNGLLLSRESVQLPLRRRDATLRSVLENAARETASVSSEVPGVVGDLRRALSLRLTGGDLRVQSVAAAMGVSSRTLQRRLAEQGQTYNGVLDVTRRDVATSYLSAGSLSVGEIAFLLGYSEPAAFHRAFRRWHGTTPSAYRLTIDD